MDGAKKKCFKCGAVKKLTEFYRHRMMADGHLNKCKECTKREAAKHRKQNIESIREYDRERAKLPHRQAKNKDVAKKYARLFPLRKAANTILNNAIRDGRIKPWPVCAVPECNKKPVAHHPDYDRPLDVVWLCQAHHVQTHRMK